VLDHRLCGSGRDVYLLAQFGGADRLAVWGIDNDPPAKLEVAEGRIAISTPKALRLRPTSRSWREPLETLGELPLVPASFDLVVFPMCGEPLQADNAGRAGRGAAACFKPGGEFYFADVYADARVPEAAASVTRWLYGRMPQRRPLLERLPAAGPRAGSPIRAGGGATGRWRHRIQNLSARTGPLRFFSAPPPVRHRRASQEAWKTRQAVILAGRIARPPSTSFPFDKHHRIRGRARVFPRLRPTPSGCWPKAAHAAPLPVHRQLRSPLRPFPGCGGGPSF